MESLLLVDKRVPQQREEILKSNDTKKLFMRGTESESDGGQTKKSHNYIFFSQLW